MGIPTTVRIHRYNSTVPAMLLLFLFTFLDTSTTTTTTTALAYSSPLPHVVVDRRTATSAAASLAAVIVTTTPAAAWASDKPTEFQNVGRQAPPPTGEAPFVTLSNGVQIKDYRIGGGDNNNNNNAAAVVQVGSKVALQITGRLLNLNGIVFYDSKNNDPDGLGGLPVTFTVGDGTALPGLEAGILGMKKGGIRRIIVPPELGYKTRNGDGGGGPLLLEPIPVNAVDKRALDSVIQNPRRDATLLFDCKLERLK